MLARGQLQLLATKAKSETFDIHEHRYALIYNTLIFGSASTGENLMEYSLSDHFQARKKDYLCVLRSHRDDVYLRRTSSLRTQLLGDRRRYWERIQRTVRKRLNYLNS